MCHHGRSATVVMLFLAVLAGCGREDAGKEKTAPKATTSELAGDLLLTGSSTMAPLTEEIGKRFHALHPKVNIRVEMGGSGRGIGDAREGKADIGMASRALTEKERDLNGFLVARDGVGLLVHKDNPVTTLSEQQITGIFTGKISNWKKVGGRDAPIAVLNREEGRGSVELFQQYFRINYSDIKAQRIVGDNKPAIEAIIGNPDAITVMSVVEAEHGAAAGASIKLLPLGGVAASAKSIISGSYPLARPLTLVTKELPKGLVKAFIEFSMSSQVTDLVRSNGFVPYQE